MSGAGTRERLLEALLRGASTLPLPEIHDFNQRARDRWVAAWAGKIPAGARVLDLGAGTCPYRELFAHCAYTAQDFLEYAGEKRGGTAAYGPIDLVSDAAAVPRPDGSADVVLLTEVLEHVPDPVAVLGEAGRLLAPNGLLLLSAPLGSGLHQEPYHFYGGFTPHFYRRFLPECGFAHIHIQANGGFLRHLAQECARLSWILPRHRAAFAGREAEIATLFGDLLPRLLFALDEECPEPAFTVGYFVAAKKAAHPA